MTFWQVVKRELRRMFVEERKTAVFLLGLPIIYVLLFGLVYKESAVRYMPTVVYDQDQSQLSRLLTQAFADSERYNVIAYVDSQEEMDQYLHENTARVAIVVPPQFAQDIKRGLGTQVLVEVNGSNLMFANSVISTAQEIVQTFSAGVGKNLVQAIGQPPFDAFKKAVPIQFGVRILNNPTYAYSNFIMAGLGANGLQLGIVLAICTTITREYRRQEEWSGIPSVRMVLAKVLPYWIGGMISFTAYVTIIVALYGLPFNGSVGEVLLIGSAFVFAVAAVGVIYSAVAPDEALAVQLPMVYIMPAFLFSGYIWPQMAMNDISLLISKILPLTYMADDLRDLLLSGYAPTLYRNAGILFAFGTVLLSISTLVVALRRKRLRAREA